MEIKYQTPFLTDKGQLDHWYLNSKKIFSVLELAKVSNTFILSRSALSTLKIFK
jgi:hypothetical protein